LALKSDSFIHVSFGALQVGPATAAVEAKAASTAIRDRERSIVMESSSEGMKGFLEPSLHSPGVKRN